MASKPFQIFIGLLLIGAMTAPAVFFHFENIRLKRRLGRQREFTQHSTRLETENRQLSDLIAKMSGDEETAARELHTELESAKRELAALEKRAVERRTQIVAQANRDADDLANNRDPLRGLVRLEYLEDIGQATPTAAFQSLASAVTRNRTERVAELFTLSDQARREADAWIAELPESERAKWTPEKLGELFLTGALTSAPSVQIASVTMDGPDRATLAFRIPGAKREPKLVMEMGPAGWRVLVDERGIGVMRKRVAQSGEAR